MDGWMTFYGPFNIISFISCRWKGADEKLTAAEFHLPRESKPKCKLSLAARTPYFTARINH